jgi:hypothetical protein
MIDPTASPFPLSDDDIATLKADFMASDPSVTFVVDDEPPPPKRNPRREAPRRREVEDG